MLQKCRHGTNNKCQWDKPVLLRSQRLQGFYGSKQELHGDELQVHVKNLWKDQIWSFFILSLKWGVESYCVLLTLALVCFVINDEVCILKCANDPQLSLDLLNVSPISQELCFAWTTKWDAWKHVLFLCKWPCLWWCSLFLCRHSLGWCHIDTLIHAQNKKKMASDKDMNL